MISAAVEEHKLIIKNTQTISTQFQHSRKTGHKIDFENGKLIASAMYDDYIEWILG